MWDVGCEQQWEALPLTPTELESLGRRGFALHFRLAKIPPDATHASDSDPTLGLVAIGRCNFKAKGDRVWLPSDKPCRIPMRTLMHDHPSRPVQ